MKRSSIEIPYKIARKNEFSDIEKKLEDTAISFALKAHAPYSKFKVGAAVLLDNGIIVGGSNQENAAYPSGTCAERTALFYAGAKYPDNSVEKLLIVAFSGSQRVPFISPCGSCRQVMMETATRFHPFEVLLCGEEQAVIIEDNKTLLPFGFDGSDLPDMK